MFQDLCHHETHSEYDQKLQLGIQAISDEKDMELLKRFTFNEQKYCFAHVPAVFFGFMPNTSMNEKLHDLVKSFMPYSRPFTVAVKGII